ncbi:DoxX family membrane protein [Corynebacterium pelargi]|uniref:DoxX n=1 Tax=Corynebacterium pelargi TaxID=1471400 RepID=A0A410W963_9CORY|nr:DoxX family protein [Corynebacterium pelargi]QAU52486.1 DoxX [Corynebacterium pelargi]GGG76743.1 hypothetical protein GCM10007338_13140 [Corynebacterium pelargi]
MIRKLARPMIASVYIADGADTVMNTQAHVDATESVVNNVRSLLPRQYRTFIPKDPETVAKAVGGTKIGAGALLALGKAPRLSAAVLALLALPSLITRNAFWAADSREEKVSRRQGFLTNLALIGGLAITSLDTEGKPGLKWRAGHAAKVANKKVQKALPTKSETEKFTENAQEQASAFAASAKDWIGDASDKVAEVAGNAKDYVDDNKDDWLKSAQKNSKVAKKKVVKAAAKAQDRAQAALEDAEKASGRAAKKADKRYGKLQKDAAKALKKAQKRVKNI